MEIVLMRNAQLEKLAVRIDKLRDVLNEISSVSGETEEESEESERLRISQKMDILIVQYMRELSKIHN